MYKTIFSLFCLQGTKLTELNRAPVITNPGTSTDMNGRLIIVKTQEMDGPLDDDYFISPSPSSFPLFNCDYTNWSPSFYIIPLVYLLIFLVGSIGNALVLWVSLDQSEGRKLRIGLKHRVLFGKTCCTEIFTTSDRDINSNGRVQPDTRENLRQNNRSSFHSSPTSYNTPIPRLSRSLTESLIANLALADLSFVVTLPLWAVYTALGDHWPFGQFLCKVSSFLTMLNMYASVFNLSVLSVERYWVLTGRRHSTQNTPKSFPSRALLIIGGIWILSTMLALPSLLLRSVQTETAESGDLLFCQMNFSMLLGADLDEEEIKEAEMWLEAILSFKSTLIGFLFPLAILLVCYCSVAQLLSKHFGRGPRPDRKRQRRLLRVIVTLVLAFFLCWLPFHVNKTVFMLLDFGFMPYSCSLEQLLLTVHPYVTCLAYLNSCLNPLLYAACDPTFRKRCRAALLMLCRLCRRGAKRREEKIDGEERSSSFPTKTQEETAERTEGQLVEEIADWWLWDGGQKKLGRMYDWTFCVTSTCSFRKNTCKPFV